jgi:hypothetical protein
LLLGNLGSLLFFGSGRRGLRCGRSFGGCLFLNDLLDRRGLAPTFEVRLSTRPPLWLFRMGGSVLGPGTSCLGTSLGNGRHAALRLLFAKDLCVDLFRVGHLVS